MPNIQRNLDFNFNLQKYESMKLGAAVSVSHRDFGVSDDELSKLTEQEYDDLIERLEKWCDELLERQLKPLLAEADSYADGNSFAHDAYDKRTKETR